MRNRTCLSSYREPQALARARMAARPLTRRGRRVGRPSVDERAVCVELARKVAPRFSNHARLDTQTGRVRVELSRSPVDDDVAPFQLDRANATRSRRGWPHDKRRPSLPFSPSAARNRSEAVSHQPPTSWSGSLSCRPTDFARRGRCLLDCRVEAARSTFRSRRLRNDGPPVSLGSSQSALAAETAPAILSPAVLEPAESVRSAMGLCDANVLSALFETRAGAFEMLVASIEQVAVSVSPRRAAQARTRSRRSHPPATAALRPSDPTAPGAVRAAARSRPARAPAPPGPPPRRPRRRTRC